MIPNCIPTVIVFTNSSHRMSTVPGLRKPHACTLAALAFNLPVFITCAFALAFGAVAFRTLVFGDAFTLSFVAFACGDVFALGWDEAFAFGDGFAFNFPIFITFTFDAALFDAALFFAVVFPFAAFARILSAAVVPAAFMCL